MTDKEFKRLSRSQLIEIIYQFQIKVEELTQENQALNKALEDKRLRITRAGNIAQAALEVNNVMQSAQNAAQQYLEEIRTLYSEIDRECQLVRKKTTDEANAVIDKARKEAASIVTQAQRKAALLLNQAQTEAKDIVGGAIQRRQEDEELKKIFMEFGLSSGK